MLTKLVPTITDIMQVGGADIFKSLNQAFLYSGWPIYFIIAAQCLLYCRVEIQPD